jgi:uncharacterized protein YdeI (YjbR/CyaY-like superfamily)
MCATGKHGQALSLMVTNKGTAHREPGIRQTENVQVARQIRFTGIREITEMEPIIKAYIREAIPVEKSGLKVSSRMNNQLIIPEEFQNKLIENPAFKSAFDSLTPGRQKGYILYFSEPKQSKTRESRVEKWTLQTMRLSNYLVNLPTVII